MGPRAGLDTAVVKRKKSDPCQESKPGLVRSSVIIPPELPGSFMYPNEIYIS